MASDYFSDAPASTPTRMSSGVRFRLSAMMFLQFFIWGAWFELGFDYIPTLGFNKEWQQPLVFGAFNVGALVALFFSTQFADRKFAAERFLAFSHLIGGLAILGLFFLPGRMGTQPGEYVSVKLERAVTDQALVPEDGKKWATGTLPGGGIVVVEGVDADWEHITGNDEKAKPVVTAVVLANQVVAGHPLVLARKEPVAPFVPFFLLMLIHSLFYVPTISITNSIAFANLSDPSRQFGPVRLWGTIGWIAASWPFIFILVDWARVPAMADTGGLFDWIGKALGTSKAGADASTAQRYIFLVAGVAALVLAAISPALPHTPPKPAKGGESLAWLKAMRLLKHPFVAVLFLVTFIDAAVHQSFFYWTASFLKTDVGIKANWVTPVMKIGQLAEIITMLFLGFVLKRLGWRTTMVLGVLGHAGRFAVFTFFPEPAPAVLINVFHGICYAFFFATVYIFVDEYFPKDVRSSAQGLFNVLILGVGPFAANFACGLLGAKYTVGGKLDYSAVFVYSLGAALLGALILAVFFNPQKPAEDPGFSRVEEDAPPMP